MKHGDFTELAKNYIHRPAYSRQIINAILQHVNPDMDSSFNCTDVGAGTGKLTKVLLEMDINVEYVVEPNDKMRKEGIAYTQGFPAKWRKGTGEATGLSSNSFNWVTMGSSFHWTDPAKSLREFHRILKPGGYFTAIWNPRNIKSSPLHQKIENIIYSKIPSMKRISSGSTNTKNWDEILVSTGHFKDVVFMEFDHAEIMSKERYMGVWKSVNDIRVQAGGYLFNKILELIEREIAGLEEVPVPYKMRAWTVQKK